MTEQASHSRESGTESAADRSSRGVAAVDRALAILSALEAATIPPTLSDLSRTTGLYKSTILRLLESLQDGGYVMRIDETKYALGPAVMQLGLAYERANPLRHQVMPILERLVAQGTESPSFHIRQTHEERLCLFRVDSNHSTLDRVHAGDRMPVRRGAAGKVLLAFGPDEEPGREMDEIRRDCFAISLGERDKLCAGVAAPVFSGGKRLLGALSLSGPRERFTEADIAWMRPRLIAAAQDLTRAMSGRYPSIGDSDED
ncbi:IclR family transcriptional regulator [Breoghania sp.]|uniref:IclR family transcriptional regulator n=1 Tax=Breoghania sp. TaxID=2065378 RepID=UPI0029C9DAF5|nr:IclR family transcriptional regulator [Breoghania sp.]